MKRTLLIGLAVAGLCGRALAQTPPAASAPSAAAVAPPPPAPPRTIVGAGASTCEAWTTAQTTNVLIVIDMFAWVEGYLYADGLHRRIDTLRAVEPAELKGLFDAYCQAYPSQTLQSAADAIEAEIQRAPPPPKS